MRNTPSPVTASSHDQVPFSGHHRIVAAIDGTAISRGVLRWTLQEAALRHASVRAVTVLNEREYAKHALPPQTRSAADNRHALLRRLVNDVLEGGSNSGIQTCVRVGTVSEILVDESQSADLLVMGSHGHGSLLSAILGSASHEVSARARCPVVVIQRGVAERADDWTGFAQGHIRRSG